MSVRRRVVPVVLDLEIAVVIVTLMGWMDLSLRVGLPVVLDLQLVEVVALPELFLHRGEVEELAWLGVVEREPNRCCILLILLHVFLTL